MSSTSHALKTITTIIPVFNEEGNLVVLHERLDRMAAALKDVRFEFLLVDDHSSDRTPEILRSLAEKDPRVKWLRLSRNSGSHAACAAGLDHAESDAIIIMAADLQDPPELIPQLVARHAEGNQIVWAVREARQGESLFTRLSSRGFYWLMSRLTHLQQPPRGADVLLADRQVVLAFRQMPERSLSLFAAFAWLGFRQSSISYVKQARMAGCSKWTIGRKVLLAMDSFVGFSYLPLRFMSLLGFLSASAGILWALVIFAMRLAGVTQAVGYASLMITILILGGLQMMMLGVLGEYLWRTLEEARRRPRYFIESASASDVADHSAWKK